MWNKLTQILNRWFYRAVAFFFPPQAGPLPTNPRMILIFSSTGIGDALVDSAAIESLHQAYPTAKIIVCAHHRRTSVARHHPHIDTILPLSKSPLSQLGLLKYFWKQRPDLVIGLHLNAEAVPLGYLLNRRAFVGSQEECRDMAFLLSHPVLTGNERHMVKVALKVAARAGGVPVPGMIYQVKPEEVAALRERFPELASKPYLVMQTGGGKTLNWRDWTVEGYIEAIRWIEAHYPHRVILTGGHDNREVGQAIAAACPNALNLVEKTTLEETAALLRGATLLVSTDTGVMHLGLAIGCPTLLLLHYRNPKAACGPLDHLDNSTPDAHRGVAPVLASSSINDTLSHCMPEAPGAASPAASSTSRLIDFSPGHQIVELPRPEVLPPEPHAGEMGGISIEAVKAALGMMI